MVVYGGFPLDLTGTWPGACQFKTNILYTQEAFHQPANNSVIVLGSS